MLHCWEWNCSNKKLYEFACVFHDLWWLVQHWSEKSDRSLSNLLSIAFLAGKSYCLWCVFYSLKSFVSKRFSQEHQYSNKEGSGLLSGGYTYIYGLYHWLSPKRIYLAQLALSKRLENMKVVWKSNLGFHFSSSWMIIDRHWYL